MKPTPPRVLSVILTLALTLLFSNAAFGQAQTLYLEGFEAGTPGWSFTGNPTPSYWHLANAGECTAASTSKMIAYNRFPTTCDYVFPSFNDGTAQSPNIVLSGQAPFTVSFNYIIKIDVNDFSTVEVKNATTGGSQIIAATGGNLTADGTLRFFSAAISGATFQPGSTVYFKFIQQNGLSANPGSFGFMVDNVRIVNSGPPAPTITSATPAHGTTSGGASILIDGTNFNNATAVNFGSNSASFAVLDNTQILATLPANLTPGYVYVSVTTSSGTGTLTNGFDYFIAPASYGASTGAPALAWDPSSLPIINETLTFDINNFAPGSLVWYWAGESNSDWGGVPLPLDTTILGLPNCTILASAEYVLAEGYSGSSLPTPIPNMGALVGNHFYFQTFVFDAGTSAIVSTNAYDVVMGN